LLPLVTGKTTMLQDTAARLDDMPVATADCLVVCNEAHRFLVAGQLREFGVTSRILLEPEGRNTAPAAALAALLEAECNPKIVLLIMPADHVIRDVAAFQAAVGTAMQAAADGKLVTFGIVPTHPETGYGYIKAKPQGTGAVPVESFVEKPDLDTARVYVDGGHCANLPRRSTPPARPVSRNARRATTSSGLMRRHFSSLPATRSTTLSWKRPTRQRWCPLMPAGATSARGRHCRRSADGNTIDGDVVTHDCKGVFIQAESRLVTAVGLEDVIVVETKDSTLVATKERSQDVKALVDKLNAQDREETRLHRQVFRPWGSYDSLENKDGFQVKRLIVNPGAVLSLQKHAHRAEHWVVVRGKARITKNDDVFDLGVNESTFIAIGDIHRIANPFDEPSHIIEVQCGDYLGEDDIVRIEDNYGREGTNT
jgi:mannose-6-phosphate isomerase-like protein (cupin superfamily)